MEREYSYLYDWILDEEELIEETPGSPICTMNQIDEMIEKLSEVNHNDFIQYLPYEEPVQKPHQPQPSISVASPDILAPPYVYRTPPVAMADVFPISHHSLHAALPISPHFVPAAPRPATPQSTTAPASPSVRPISDHPVHAAPRPATPQSTTAPVSPSMRPISHHSVHAAPRPATPQSTTAPASPSMRPISHHSVHAAPRPATPQSTTAPASPSMRPISHHSVHAAPRPATPQSTTAPASPSMRPISHHSVHAAPRLATPQSTTAPASPSMRPQPKEGVDTAATQPTSPGIEASDMDSLLELFEEHEEGLETSSHPRCNRQLVKSQSLPASRVTSRTTSPVATPPATPPPDLLHKLRNKTIGEAQKRKSAILIPIESPTTPRRGKAKKAQEAQKCRSSKLQKILSRNSSVPADLSASAQVVTPSPQQPRMQNSPSAPSLLLTQQARVVSSHGLTMPVIRQTTVLNAQSLPMPVTQKSVLVSTQSLSSIQQARRQALGSVSAPVANIMSLATARTKDPTAVSPTLLKTPRTFSLLAGLHALDNVKAMPDQDLGVPKASSISVVNLSMNGSAFTVVSKPSVVADVVDKSITSTAIISNLPVSHPQMVTTVPPCKTSVVENSSCSVSCRSVAKGQGSKEVASESGEMGREGESVKYTYVVVNRGNMIPMSVRHSVLDHDYCKDSPRRVICDEIDLALSPSGEIRPKVKPVVASLKGTAILQASNKLGTAMGQGSNSVSVSAANSNLVKAAPVEVSAAAIGGNQPLGSVASSSSVVSAPPPSAPASVPVKPVSLVDCKKILDTMKNIDMKDLLTLENGELKFHPSLTSGTHPVGSMLSLALQNSSLPAVTAAGHNGMNRPAELNTPSRSQSSQPLSQSAPLKPDSSHSVSSQPSNSQKRVLQNAREQYRVSPGPRTSDQDRSKCNKNSSLSQSAPRHAEWSPSVVAVPAQKKPIPDQSVCKTNYGGEVSTRSIRSSPVIIPLEATDPCDAPGRQETPHVVSGGAGKGAVYSMPCFDEEQEACPDVSEKTVCHADMHPSPVIPAIQPCSDSGFSAEHRHYSPSGKTQTQMLPAPHFIDEFDAIWEQVIHEKQTQERRPMRSRRGRQERRKAGRETPSQAVDPQPKPEEFQENMEECWKKAEPPRPRRGRGGHRGDWRPGGSPIREDKSSLFSKLPTYFTALSRPTLTGRKELSALNPEGMSIQDCMPLDRSPHREKASVELFDKMPSYFNCFTNSTKYDDVRLPSVEDAAKAGEELSSEGHLSAEGLSPHKSPSPARSTASSRGSKDSPRGQSDSSYGSLRSRLQSRPFSSDRRKRQRSSSGSDSSSRSSDLRQQSAYQRELKRFRSQASRRNGYMERSSRGERDMYGDVDCPGNSERKTVYVGRIPDGYSRERLKNDFIRYGPIKEVRIHFREAGDNYGFVTYFRTKDAYTAIDKGKSASSGLDFDLCFGQRRQFCADDYADLDGNLVLEEEYAGVSSRAPVDDYDRLLRQAKQQIYSERS